MPEKVLESAEKLNTATATQQQKDKQREDIRYEQIKALSEQERKDRVTRKLEKLKEAREAEKAKKQRRFFSRKETKKTPRKQYERIASRLLKNVEAGILVEDRGKEKTQQRLSFEAEVTLDKLFRVFNSKEYHVSIRANALQDAMAIHRKAHSSLEVAIRQLEGKKAKSADDQLELDFLKELKTDSEEKYQQKVTQMKELVPEAEATSLKPEEASIQEIMKRANEIENARREKLIPASYDQKAIGLKRVANHRKLRKIDKELEELRYSRSRRSEKTGELEAERQAVLLDQLEQLAQTTVETKIQAEEGSNPQKVLELLGKASGEDFNQITTRYRNTMLSTEFYQWQELKDKRGAIKRLNTKLSGLSLMGMMPEQVQSKIKGLVLTDEEMGLLEILSDPEVTGRLRVFYADQRRENAPRNQSAQDLQPDLLEDLQDYEKWRLEGDKADRFAAATEDFAGKLMELEEEDFTSEDFHLTLASYNLAKRNPDGTWEYDREFAPKIKALKEKAEKIKNQYLSAEALLPENEEDMISRRAAEKVVNAIEGDIASGTVALSELYKAGVVELVPTNTGISVVINSYQILNGKDGDLADPKLQKQLAELTAKLGVDINAATLNGLGVTFKEEKLTYFRSQLRGDLVKGAIPSVNILVLPNRDDYIKQQMLLLAHEQSDYLIDQLLIPASGKQTKEEEATREVISRLFDGKISADTLTDLQDLYLTDRDPSPDPVQRRHLFQLIKLSEEIFKANKDQMLPTGQYSYVSTDNMVRNQLAMDIIGQIQRSGFDGINEKYLQELAKKYEVELPKLDINKFYIEKDKTDRSAGINALNREKFKYSADPYCQPLIGPLGDDTSPMNTAHQEATQRGMYMPKHYGKDKPPSMYGGEGNALYDIWEYNVDKRQVPLKYWLPRVPVITPMLNLPGIKLLTGAIGNIPFSPKALTNYEFRRAIGARLYRSNNPRLRDMGKYYVGTDYLGANPAKYFKYINPQYEGLFKNYLPGIQKAYRVEEGRNRMPVSLQMDVEDFTHKKGLQWMMAIMSEGGVGQIKGMRFLGELLGSKFDFDPMTNQYKFKRDENKMRNTHDLVTDIIEKKNMLSAEDLEEMKDLSGDALYEAKGKALFDRFLTRNFKTIKDAEKAAEKARKGETRKERIPKVTEPKNAGKYFYAHHSEGILLDKSLLVFNRERKMTPWAGAGQGFARMLNPARRFISKGEGKLQKAAGDYYSDYVTRSTLPGKDADKIGWRDQIGSKFRDFLESRDGFVAYMTMKDEYEHFKEHNIIGKAEDGNPLTESYSLYSIVNMIHIAEDALRGDSVHAWAVADKDMKLKFIERGEEHEVEIRKGENLVDAHGNLIPYLFQEGTHFKVNDDNYVELMAEKDMRPDQWLETRKYWGRLVGDRLNPDKRFIRLNSEASMKKAVEWFGGDKNIDEGFDEQNVLLQTDYVKNALQGLQQEVLLNALEKGLPPDRRYAMERNSKNEDMIKFQQNFKYTNNARQEVEVTQSFDENGLATDQFKAFLLDRLRLIYSYKVKEGNPPETHPMFPTLYKEIVGDDFNRVKATKIIADELGQRHNPSFDPLFETAMDFKTEKQPSWTNPYRQELEAVDPRPHKELTTLADTLRGGMDTFRGRYEKAQELMDQWMVAVRKVSQFERIAYEKAGYYKGISQWLKRLTNQGMVAGILLAAATASPLGIYLALGSYGLRNFARPAANKNAKKWHARRLKALDRAKEIMSMDGIFQSAAQGEIPGLHDIKRMMYYTEVVTFWLEDLANTDPPDDWYPNDDLVLKKSSEIFGKIDEKLQEWSQIQPEFA